MSQVELFLIVTAMTGLLTSRWMLRLAPLGSELPLKTLGATLLAGLVAASAWLPFSPSPTLVVFSLIVTPLYAFSPLLLVWLSRARAYRLAARLTDLLYWTPEGRSALRRLLSQAALQQGDAEAALTLLPPSVADPLTLAQVYALKEQWEKVLSLKVPPQGDNAFLALDARVQAYLALGRLEQAATEIAAMRERFAREQGPIGFRSLSLSEARLAAERGQFQLVREKLNNPPPGIPAYLVFALAARAAEQAQARSEAVTLYKQAYALAPASRRESYAAKLQAYGESLPPPVQVRRPYGMLSLLVALLLAYALQLWLDAAFGPFGSSAGSLRASSVVAAFMMNLPGIPESEAGWRYLSYAFLHGNLVHIGFNAWVLFDIGRLYESRRSWGSLLAAFVAGTLMGAYLTVLAGSSTPLLLVGASGGILGIAGALLADSWRGKGAQDRLLTRSLVQWMIVLVLFSLVIPNVSLWGHVGGVIGGLLWGFTRQGLPKSRRIDLFAGGLSIGLLAYALIQATRLFLEHVL